MKLLWQTYYKMKLGADYDAAVNRAKLFSKYTTGATTGKVSIFYNANGDQIRGWHKAPMKFKMLHPLVEHYAAK